MAPSSGRPSLYHVTFKSIEAVALQVSTTWVPVLTSVEIGFKVIVGASEKTMEQANTSEHNIRALAFD